MAGHIVREATKRTRGWGLGLKVAEHVAEEAAERTRGRGLDQ